MKREIARRLRVVAAVLIASGCASIVKGAEESTGVLSVASPEEVKALKYDFEAAAVIVVLVLVGQVLELRARSRTGAAIRALLNLGGESRSSRLLFVRQGDLGTLIYRPSNASNRISTTLSLKPADNLKIC